MSTPARRSITHTPRSWMERVPRQWSAPHLRVMNALAKTGISFLSEQPILDAECANPHCHHHYIADILVLPNIIIEVHGDFNDKGRQEMRKHCLEASGYIVISLGVKAAMEIPDVLAARIREMLRFRAYGGYA